MIVNHCPFPCFSIFEEKKGDFNHKQKTCGKKIRSVTVTTTPQFRANMVEETDDICSPYITTIFLEICVKNRNMNQSIIMP